VFGCGLAILEITERCRPNPSINTKSSGSGEGPGWRPNYWHSPPTRIAPTHSAPPPTPRSIHRHQIAIIPRHNATRGNYPEKIGAGRTGSREIPAATAPPARARHRPCSRDHLPTRRRTAQREENASNLSLVKANGIGQSNQLMRVECAGAIVLVLAL